MNPAGATSWEDIAVYLQSAPVYPSLELIAPFYQIAVSHLRDLVSTDPSASSLSVFGVKNGIAKS